MWKSYLEEVRVGTGIFSEDEQLRDILHECFEQGDAINGVMYWGEAAPGWIGDPADN